MSAEIGPGDFVEAAHDLITYPIPRGTVGRVTRIGVVGLCRCGLEARGIHVDIAPLPAGNQWCTCAWRPVYRPKPDAFTDLLKVPDRQRVTA